MISLIPYDMRQANYKANLSKSVCEQLAIRDDKI